jgi:hypothetical protein
MRIGSNPNINPQIIQEKPNKDPFDLQIKASETDTKIKGGMVRSISLCTPTCPNGTYHSFCC